MLGLSAPNVKVAVKLPAPETCSFTPKVVFGVGDPDPQADVDPGLGQVAAEQPAFDRDRLAPGDSVWSHGPELDLGRDQELDLSGRGSLGRRAAGVGCFDQS